MTDEETVRARLHAIRLRLVLKIEQLLVSWNKTDKPADTHLPARSFSFRQ